MLGKLCHAHPQMAVTHEFGALLYVQRPYLAYAQALLARSRYVGSRWGFVRTHEDARRTLLQNRLLTGRYLLNLFGVTKTGVVRETAVEQALRRTFPHRAIVGDKTPQYINKLETITQAPSLRCVVIYRDCRDVTSSFLVKRRTEWRDLDWAQKWDTAEKIAQRWVNRIELMEQFAEQVYIMRYETLVQSPHETLTAFSDWLGIDAAGFEPDKVQDTSIGNYRQKLTEAEVADVMTVAGPTMARLGYV